MGNPVNALLRRLRRTTATPDAKPTFESWSDLSGPTLAVCHPEWRGVRAAAHAFGDPVVETVDAGSSAAMIVDHALEAGIETLVVHGFPPGADTLLTVAHQAGLRTRAVVHSSMAQHGAEAWEAAVIDSLVALTRSGRVGALGFVKAGMAEVFSAMGINARYTPNRAPSVPKEQPIPLGDGLHVGVFASPFWRKNVVTQLGAVSLMRGATAHVMRRPNIAYLSDVSVVEHGELPRGEFLRLQGSVDLNLYVTLSECHPLSPVESFLSGVPCLISRTSALFRDEPDLLEIVSVSEADDPSAIAAAAARLLAAGAEVIDAANAWIVRADQDAAERWADFLETPEPPSGEQASDGAKDP